MTPTNADHEQTDARLASLESELAKLKASVALEFSRPCPHHTVAMYNCPYCDEQERRER